MAVRLLIGFIVAFASSVGFGIITNVPRRTLLPAGVTGGASWVVYLAMGTVTTNVLLPNLLAAVTIGLLANAAAVLVRAPVNVLYIPCLVALVPGAIIYMAMKDFTLGQDSAASQGFIKTLTIAIALAVGFVIAEAIFAQIRPSFRRWVDKHVPLPRTLREEEQR
ncbi:threonine/serine exporter family protein [Lacticaseibacillus yichunensis]|uniref:Threonine/serine exporter family protein n=1 Tax=Lacticaseibacillus yichunensis TaxID=2486015 RepID=A0ABW4CN17_9LACO|nr:threonine/serine exporter family protein [Lacticaseibacillus yichunensis]